MDQRVKQERQLDLVEQSIGRLETVPVRDIWPHEAVDFTPWLAENLQLLGNEIGMDLELEGTEAPIGDFSLDILARETNSNAVVAIENQIGRTDHSHLGQLLTYAAGKNAAFVVWIATEFREEHRAALDWLNQTSRESVGFFGVEVQAVRINNSLPAPLFRLVASPNAWSKVAASKQDAVTPQQEKYFRFWRPLLFDLRTRHGWSISTRHGSASYTAGVGVSSNIGRAMRFSQDRQARVELRIHSSDTAWNKDVFDILKESSTEIEKELGKLCWERMDDAKASRVATTRPGSIDDSEQDLDEIREWMIDNVLKFRSVFQPHLKNVLKRMDEFKQEDEDGA